jgi:hypothetical protein
MGQSESEIVPSTVTTSSVSWSTRPQLKDFLRGRGQKKIERGRTASYPTAPHRSRRAVFRTGLFVNTRFRSKAKSLVRYSQQ